MAAPYRGCSGVIKVAASPTASAGGYNAVAKVSDWQFEETSEQIDASSMGACVKSFLAGAKATTGTITCWWDNDDTNGQSVLIVGNTVGIKFYPAGTGETAYRTASSSTGGAVITSVARQGGGVDGVVGSTFGFAVKGALTATG